MNSLHSKVDEYLALRRALGFHLRREGCSLPQFADWMQRRQTATITAALAIEWARLPIGVHPVTWSHRLSAVRMFARWLAATDPTVEIPPSSVFPGQGKRPDPYIYSDDEIAALLAAAHTILRPALRAATIETMLGLLAVSGVRVGEACRLGRRDIDLATGLLTVVEGKSRSPRILPLHPSTVEALASYAALRDARHPDAVTFFVSLHGTTLTPGAVRNAFLPLTTHTGLRVGNRGPRVHDLRHSFAVRQLIEWYRAGRAADDIALLSGYLGHANPSGTYWYATAVPELMALAAARLDDQHHDDEQHGSRP